MALKHLKDKIINVRATEKTKVILEVLADQFKISQADVVELALNELYKSREYIELKK